MKQVMKEVHRKVGVVAEVSIKANMGMEAGVDMDVDVDADAMMVEGGDREVKWVRAEQLKQQELLMDKRKT